MKPGVALAEPERGFMFNSAVLEVTAGVLVVFLLVSTVCTAIREGIEARFKTRAAYLDAGIRELLRDEAGTGIARAFFEHPIIYGLYTGGYQPSAQGKKALASGGSLPSYISGRSFALVLMDIVARGPTTDAASTSPELPPVTLATLRRNVGSLGNPHLERMLLLAIDSAEGDIERARQNLHDWFDDSMERVSGWYKRSTQKVLFVVALVVTVGLNINTLTIAQYLYESDVARATLVAAAERAVDEGAPAGAAARTELEALALPIGWDQGYGAPNVKAWPYRDASGKWVSAKFQPMNDIVGTLAGLLITVFAAMLGAPFWFDILSRVMAIRSTTKPKTARPAKQAPDAQASITVGTAADASSPASPAPVVHIAAEARAVRPPDDDGDSCDHPITSETRDEELPQARGGVAA